jgi:hypothetical protein
MVCKTVGCFLKQFTTLHESRDVQKNPENTTGGKFVVADQKIAGRNKAHCIYIQNKAES